MLNMTVTMFGRRSNFAFYSGKNFVLACKEKNYVGRKMKLNLVTTDKMNIIIILLC